METIDKLLENTRGILKLKPNFVTRYYMDHARLGLSEQPGGTYNSEINRWLPERWIASTALAAHSNPAPGEGLSFLDVPGEPITLTDAIAARPEAILGPVLARHAPMFPVLNKILDPHYPIVFHFHARDEDVKNFPQHFRGHKLGKEEAYYFLPRPKGPVPYTHLGLHAGVTRDDLSRAVEKGGNRALELSPVAAQKFGEGMYVPSGVPHRPGTALTLEIQQPSDVSLHLDWYFMGNKKTPEQTHPGFGSIEESLQFVDFERAATPEVMQKNYLIPELIEETRQPGQGEEHWIFPLRMTPKFSGKRARVTGTFEMREPSPYVLLVWSGRGQLNGTPIKAGDEFLVTHPAAVMPHHLKSEGSETLEVFKLFPPDK